MNALTFATSVLVCLAPTLGLAAPAPLDIDSKRVEINVKTEAIENRQAQKLREGLEQSLRGELEQGGFEVVDRDGDATLEARVELRDTELLIYAISVDFVVGDMRESLVDMAPCVACPQQDLVDETLEVLPPLRGYLPVDEPEPVEEPEEPDVPAPGAALAGQPQDDALRGGLALGPLGVTGITSLSAGIASIVTGTVLMSMPKPADYIRDPGRIGGLVLAAGAGFAAAGAVLVAVDVLVVQRSQNIQIAADVAPTHAGLRVSGRF